MLPIVFQSGCTNLYHHEEYEFLLLYTFTTSSYCRVFIFVNLKGIYLMNGILLWFSFAFLWLLWFWESFVFLLFVKYPVRSFAYFLLDHLCFFSLIYRYFPCICCFTSFLFYMGFKYLLTCVFSFFKKKKKIVLWMKILTC